MSEKHKEICKYLTYIGQLLILASTVTGYILICAFTWLVAVLVGITISEVGLEICAVSAGINKYKSIIKKRKKRYCKIVLLGKD